MPLFMIKSFGNVEEFVRIDGGFSEISEAVRKSEFQFLTKEKLTISVSDSGGIEFPDLVIYDTMYLFSDIIYQEVRNEIDWYVFVKPIDLVCDFLGRKERYWLIVPPRIDCLDLDRSDVKLDWDFSLGLLPTLHSQKSVIDESLVGSYKMWKIAGVDDDAIYVKKELKDKILSLNPEGIKFIACEEEL